MPALRVQGRVSWRLTQPVPGSPSASHPPEPAASLVGSRPTWHACQPAPHPALAVLFSAGDGAAGRKRRRTRFCSALASARMGDHLHGRWPQPVSRSEGPHFQAPVPRLAVTIISRLLEPNLGARCLQLLHPLRRHAHCTPSLGSDLPTTREVPWAGLIPLPLRPPLETRSQSIPADKGIHLPAPHSLPCAPLGGTDVPRSEHKGTLPRGYTSNQSLIIEERGEYPFKH